MSDGFIWAHAVSAPFLAYLAWNRAAVYSTRRRVRIRVIAGAVLFTPGILGKQAVPAIYGLIQGLDVMRAGPILQNALLLACGGVLAFQAAHLAEFSDRLRASGLDEALKNDLGRTPYLAAVAAGVLWAYAWMFLAGSISAPLVIISAALLIGAIVGTLKVGSQKDVGAALPCALGAQALLVAVFGVMYMAPALAYVDLAGLMLALFPIGLIAGFPLLLAGLVIGVRFTRRNN